MPCCNNARKQTAFLVFMSSCLSVFMLQCLGVLLSWFLVVFVPCCLGVCLVVFVSLGFRMLTVLACGFVFSYSEGHAGA